MTQYPAMPLFADVLLADTEHLDDEEFGAYVRMFCHSWLRADCMLPNDDLQLARIAHLTPERWQEKRGILLQFWRVDSGSRKLFQKRQMKERKRVQKIVARNRGAALSRWKTTKTTSTKSMPPKPKPLHDILNTSAARTRAREDNLNGSAAMASSPAIGGRSSATPSNNPDPENELPVFGSFVARSTDPTTITPAEAELIRARLKH